MSCIDEIVDFAAFFSCTMTKKDQDSSGGTGRDGTGRSIAKRGTGRERKASSTRDGTGRDGFFIVPRSSGSYRMPTSRNGRNERQASIPSQSSHPLYYCARSSLIREGGVGLVIGQHILAIAVVSHHCRFNIFELQLKTMSTVTQL